MKTDSSTHIYPAFRLLLIEDNIADIKLMLEAIKWSGLKNHAEVEYAINAEQAYEMMAAAHAEGNPYKMFTLDLNMPRIDGKEVLTNLKKDNRYAHIPVFIISNSDAMTDITDCEKLGADGYIQKPT
jgi:chemotaxis family two-component system response regulator Rcp1